jgi:hypothetical protein
MNIKIKYFDKLNNCPCCNKNLNVMNKLYVSGKTNRNACSYCEAMLYTSFIVRYLHELVATMLCLSIIYLGFVYFSCFSSIWFSLFFWAILGYVSYYVFCNMIISLFKYKIY